MAFPVRRGKGIYFCKAVPKYLVSIPVKTEIKFSLSTFIVEAARPDFARLNSEWQERFQSLRRGITGSRLRISLPWLAGSTNACLPRLMTAPSAMSRPFYGRGHSDRTRTMEPLLKPISRLIFEAQKRVVANSEGLGYGPDPL